MATATADIVLAVSGPWCGRIHISLHPESTVCDLTRAVHARTQVFARQLSFGSSTLSAADDGVLSLTAAGIQNREVIHVSAGTGGDASTSATAPSIAGGVLDGAAHTHKRQAAAEEEAQKQTKRQRSVEEAGMQSKRENVAGMRNAIGTLDQAKAAKHKEMGGMDKATKKTHLEGGLADTRKKPSKLPAKKVGIHGFKKKK
jgi:hypothetical protein